jgi:hypothetical protein
MGQIRWLRSRGEWGQRSLSLAQMRWIPDLRFAALTLSGMTGEGSSVLKGFGARVRLR